jgi:hypothetical protein
MVFLGHAHAVELTVLNSVPEDRLYSGMPAALTSCSLSSSGDVPERKNPVSRRTIQFYRRGRRERRDANDGLARVPLRSSAPSAVRNCLLLAELNSFVRFVSFVVVCRSGILADLRMNLRLGWSLAGASGECFVAPRVSGRCSSPFAPRMPRHFRGAKGDNQPQPEFLVVTERRCG